MQKNLVIISPGFPADENDTTCLPSQQLLVRAINRNFPDITVSIVSLQYPYHTQKYQWHGNLVIPLHEKRFPKFFRPLLWLKAKTILDKLHKEQPVDGMLSFWCQETALIGDCFSGKTIPHKIWICGQDARANNRFVKWIKPKPDELMAISDFLAHEFGKNHNILPAYVVPNGIVPIVNINGENERDIDILAVGSLIPLKQYTVFVDVVNSIAKSNRKLKAVLVGDGIEKENLLAKIRSLQLQQNIELTGTLPHPEVLKLFCRSKIFLHPSSFEGFSTACLEALNGGCKVVCFTRPMKTVIPNWHIVSDTEEMFKTTREILNTPQLYSPVTYNSIDDTAKQIISQLFVRV